MSLIIDGTTGISATGNITGNYLIGNGSLLAGIDATSIQNGTSNVRVVSSGGNIAASVGGTSNVMVITTTAVSITGDLSVSGNATLSGNILGDRIQNGTTLIDIQAPNGNANISVGGTSNVAVFATTGQYVTGVISATGNVIAGNLITTGFLYINSDGFATAIVNGAGNGVGNIGNSSNYFNRLFAQATTALYADLAEMYSSDVTYPPGTVLVFGGNQEVTISSHSHDNRVAGVVSTHPAHVMNSGQPGDHVLAVALAGRVPVNVIGPIQPGDCVVTSSTPGVAEVMDITRYQPGVVIGKALQEYSGTGVGTIEVVVGRL